MFHIMESHNRAIHNVKKLCCVGKKEQRVVVGKKERERRIVNTLLALCAFEE